MEPTVSDIRTFTGVDRVKANQVPEIMSEVERRTSGAALGKSRVAAKNTLHLKIPGHALRSLGAESTGIDVFRCWTLIERDR